MTDEFRGLIQEFGVTGKEADTYLSILENGPTTATEIADEANVSRRHVYNVAKRLEDRNFVIVNNYFTPTTLEAAPPDEVYDRIEERADKLYRCLTERYQDGADGANDIRVLKSRSTVINKIDDLVRSADDQIALSLPAVVVPRLEDSLRDAVDRDVLILLLVYEDQDRTQAEADPLADVSLDGIAHVVRYQPSNLPILMSVDKETAFVSSRGVITRPKSPVNAIYLGQPYLEWIVFGCLVNLFWENADQVSVTTPAALPHTYTNVRRLAVDAVLYRQSGTEIVAEVEGRPPDSPESVVNVVGEVCEVKQRLVDPAADIDPNQCTVCLQTEDGVVTVGGKGAVSEDYRAYKTTLREA